MRAIIQRITHGSVKVENELISEIDKGILVLLGISLGDNPQDCDYLINKIINLRIFPDSNNKMNLSVKDLNYSALIISQFTLYGDCRKGNRPNFMEAASSEKANELYEYFIDKISKEINTKCGKFKAMMNISVELDGPVTILLDSKKFF